ncbi:MAG TPA: tRNA (adenosine(37)-N6)-dimethylallyltransferase MiaA, partial [Pyrinomonadaceae bacterium]|nr:tRNA (adenosine(37)-N6)-dimethylallyltransferase MiaA [Pyrinomonadaceae bacterium]
MSSSVKTGRPIVAVVGPTASGKSDLGIALALRAGGEIINCDSVQVYREIQIATAKVPFEERRGVLHHLIDFVPPEVRYTAADWARDALRVIEEIEARGRASLLVGGTGFYLRALREPFFDAPPTDERLRLRLERVRERRGAERLHRLLARLDPESAARLHARD